MIKVALLVGVSEYQPGLQPLPSAIEDVRAMERVLQHPEMGGFDEVEVLPNPKTQDLRLAIYNLFAERSPEDLVLFYFSGHGVKDQNRDLYLTTPETTKSQKGLVVSPTAVKASYLQEQINNSRSQHEVIILDCCYSGAIAKGLTAKDEGEVDIIAELGGKGRAILTSSTSVQSSFQQEGALSIYTQYLVEGIETGAADLDSDGRISTDELHQYATKKVQQASPAMTPQFYPVEEGYKIYLARSPIDDPKLRYRQEVEKIVQENQGEIDPILDRPYLDELSHNLEISLEDVKIIETEVLEPFRQHQQKLQSYEEVFSQALQKDSVLTDRTRRKLKRLQEVLGLSDEDVEGIEKPILDQKEAEYQKQQEEERLRHQQEAERLRRQREEAETLRQQQEVKNKQEVTKSVSESVATPSLQVFEFEVVTVNIQRKWWGLGSEITLNRHSSQAQYFTEDLGNGVILDMVYIPGGKFLMGSPEGEGYDSEKPQHEVTVQPFFIGKYPVTQAQWRAITSCNDLKVNRDLKPDSSHFKDDDRPVELVSWDDAVEFYQRLWKKTGKEYRLPSEAEWEYACRAGTTTPFHFGETITGELANYNAQITYANEPKGEYRGTTKSVGSFPPNAFGLYDMHGNVWEWCEDDWHKNYEGAPTNGSAWLLENSNEKVIRGGSWYGYPYYCRSAFRSYDTREYRSCYIGVRVVCVVPRTT